MRDDARRAGLLRYALLAAVLAAPCGALAADVKDIGDEDAPAEFTPEYLADGDVLRSGKKLWGKTCKLCHGNTAYPGKAPKLGTKCYEPEFVYDRVTNGFNAMPAWKSQIAKSDRMAVAAYVVSKRFPTTCER